MVKEAFSKTPVKSSDIGNQVPEKTKPPKPAYRFSGNEAFLQAPV